ncbi:lytic transglycosylase domain-containing protein [Novosphingobium ginsenosidimutans]|uniref:lytic transglycosylase domain-containing protein n=1 Tax=Novosphingobium ginsenosidimutans TaxID=1176536 RepID=UPI001EE15BCE|nr:lytic transglycosylase domain-containing protein [Novosphingobium ginsenosidimutans]
MGQASIIANTAAAPTGARPEVQAAIARAAQATGVDFSYLLAQARLESSLDPAARATTSSAAGLYQFTGGTWLQTLEKHGAAHGAGWADTAIEAGRVSDPMLRQQVLALRHDPDLSARMAAELARDNRAALLPVLGREPDAAELYLAHFLGAGGATKFLTALSADPAQNAAMLLPEAAAANRAIFYEGGQPRSLGGVMGLLRDKVDRAMDAPTEAAPWSTAALVAEREPLGAPELGSSQRPSISATLASTFALGPGGDAPAHIRAAYGKLKAFGL